MMEPSDRRRIDALYIAWRVGGDPRSLGALFDATAPELFELAARLAPDAGGAEDALMETFLAVMDRGGPAPAGPVVPWLVGILRNQVARVRRDGRRRPDPARVRPQPPPGDPAELAVRAEETERLHHALEDLPAPYREVAILRFRFGLEPAEIACAKGLPPGTVRSLLSRAAEKLRGRIGAPAAIVLGGRPRRGIESIRDQLLRRAAASEAAAGALLLAGGIVVGKKLVVIAVLLVLVLAGGAAVVLGPRGGEISDARRPGPPASEASARLGEAILRESAGDAERGGAAAPADPRSRAETAPGRLIEVLVRWPDGTPAAGIGAKLLAWDAPDPLNRRIRARTDESGRLTVHGVPAGRVTVYLDRGGSASVGTDAEGVSPTVLLAVREGVDVEGVVTSAEGEPVAGADVLLSDYGNQRDWTIAAQSDVRGRFALRSVAGGHWLRSRADGHAPSDLVAVAGEAGARREIRLALRGPGGRVEGRVVDAEGVPVAGARVVAGGPPAGPVTGFETITDADGSFSIDGLPPGLVVLAARAAGHAPFVGRAVIDPAVPADATIRLPAAATIRGVVRDEAGTPVAGAVVYAGERYGEFTTSFAYSDAAGRFTLVDVPPGAVRLVAARDDAGRAEETTVVAEGGTLDWNPRLSEGAVLAGRVVDDHGAPLAGLQVQVDDGAQGGGRVNWATSDEDGRFRFSNLGSTVVDLAVFTGPRSGLHVQLAARKSVAIDEEAVEIVVPRATMPSAFIEGRLLDPTGAPIHGGTVFLRSVGASTGPTVTTDAAGRFRAGPLPPGTHSTAANADGHPGLDLGDVTVAAGETVNLGDRIFPSAGAVRIRLRREDGGPVRHAWGAVHGPEGLAPANWNASGPEVRREAVAEGQHGIQARTFDAGTEYVGTGAVAVTAGRTSEVEIVLAKVVRQELRVECASGDPPPAEVRIRIHAPGGECVGDFRLAAASVLSLPPGRWRIEAIDGIERRVETTIEIREGGEGGAIVLRLP